MFRDKLRDLAFLGLNKEGTKEDDVVMGGDCLFFDGLSLGEFTTFPRFTRLSMKSTKIED